MEQSSLNEDRQYAVVAYNANKKEMIGIFANIAMAGRYLYKERYAIEKNNMMNAAKAKKLLQDTVRFNFPVALRIADSKHQECLGSLDYLMFNMYPEPIQNQIMGFNGSRIQLADKCVREPKTA